MNTKLLLVSVFMALSAVSTPTMAQSTPTEINISDTKQTITVATIVLSSMTREDLQGKLLLGLVQ